MKLTLKNITLNKDTLEDINKGNIDTTKYVNYISTCLDNANYLIKEKIRDLDDLELYNALSKIFNIELEEKDLLKILSKKNNKHYLYYLTINTNMVDEDGKMTILKGIATKNVPYTDRNVPLKTIRKIINSYDFIVTEITKVKPIEKLAKPEKYEEYETSSFTLDFNQDEDLFAYKIALLRQETKDNSVLKRILNQIEQYIKELIYQAKSIYRIEDDDDENKKEISRQYKKAFEDNFTKKEIFIKGRHKKSH